MVRRGVRIVEQSEERRVRGRIVTITRNFLSFYVVQFGWIVFAEMNLNGECQLCFLREGETVTVKPFVHHTIFMSSNAVTHTIKYGDVRSGIDWFPSEKLDEFTHKSLKSSY